MAKVPKEVLDLFAEDEAIKVLASTSKEGQVNVVPVGSVGVLDEETLVFGDIFLNKTKQNLETTKRVSAMVFKPPMDGYQAKGVFMGWQTSGPAYDLIVEKLKKMGDFKVKAAGTIKVQEAYSIAPLTPGRKMM